MLEMVVPVQYLFLFQEIIYIKLDLQELINLLIEVFQNDWFDSFSLEILTFFRCSVLWPVVVVAVHFVLLKFRHFDVVACYHFGLLRLQPIVISFCCNFGLLNLLSVIIQLRRNFCLLPSQLVVISACLRYSLLSFFPWKFRPVVILSR